MRFAIELENAGKVNETIEIYEKLVVDQIDDVHSYHRLFQYYSQIGRLEEVHRICAAYIEMTNALEAIGIVRKDLTSLRNVFEQYV
jgi:tetratricopeptide (TPR) repeat protein